MLMMARKKLREQALAELFLDHGAEIDARDEEYCSTPLGWAARGGRKEMVEFLLARGAHTTLPDDAPWATPLSWVEKRGHPEIAEILREVA
jgi:ankyrin repeat protein